MALLPKSAWKAAKLAAEEMLKSFPTEAALDYFAGPGTTGLAVSNLKPEDGGRRKFMLVETGEYVQNVLLRRMKKVTFVPTWKEGMAKRLPTEEKAGRNPRIVKVLRLESCEDAPNNIAFDEESARRATARYAEAYLLRHTAKGGDKKRGAPVDVKKTQSPFSCKLQIHREGGTRAQLVDMPETSSYVLGLDVERDKTLIDGNRRYLVRRGTTRDGGRVAVMWRETRSWEEDYKPEAALVAEQKSAQGGEEVAVNGDSVTSGARSLNGVFKARLFR